MRKSLYGGLTCGECRIRLATAQRCKPGTTKTGQLAREKAGLYGLPATVSGMGRAVTGRRCRTSSLPKLPGTLRDPVIDCPEQVAMR